MAGDSGRKSLFPSLEAIAGLNYFDLLHYAAAMMPVVDKLLPNLIGKTLTPWEYRSPAIWKKLFYAKAATVREKTLGKKV